MADLPLYQLQSVSPSQAGSVAIVALQGLEKFNPAEQMAGLAIVFQAMLDRYGVRYSDAMDVAHTMFSRSAHGATGTGMRAIRKLMKGEW
jgi:hypothetical protein